MKESKLLLAEVLAEAEIGRGDISELATHIAVDGDGDVYTWIKKPRLSWDDDIAEWLSPEGDRCVCCFVGWIEDFNPDCDMESYCWSVDLIE